jgi:hypothetical protein
MVAARLCAWIALLTSFAIQEPGPSGAIAGRVFDADTGAPLAGVQVGSRVSGWHVTGPDGRYLLPSLRPGPFAAWIRGRYIAVGPAAPKHVTVVAGQTRGGADFHVRLEGAISGLVLDDRGAALEGIRIVAVGREYGTAERYGELREFATGELRYYSAGFATTNAQGAFRIDRVQAGRPYRLLAFQPKLAQRARSSDPPRGVPAFRATYYPSAPTYDAGEVVRVSSLEHRENVEIRMTRTPSYCVSAATSLSTNWFPTISFALEEDEVHRVDGFSGRASFRTPQYFDETRQMRVCGVAPGRYLLAIGDGATPFNATATGVTGVTVVDRDVHVVAPGESPVYLNAEVGWADPADRARGGITIAASPDVETLGGERAFPSTFPVRLSRQPHYSLLIGLPPAFYVHDVRYNGTSILDRSLVADNSFTGTLSVIVARDAATLTTHVHGSDGQPSGGSWVFLLPAGAQTESQLAAAMVVGLTSEDGGVAIGGLRPGAYHVLALDVPPPSLIQLPSRRPRLEMWPETMQRLLRARTAAPRVDVGPGASVHTSVTPISLR